MGRGGRRSTSYTPTWKHGKTRTIRVPIELADEGLELIRALDEGHSVGVTQAKDEEFWQAVLILFDRYIEEESQRDRKGNQYGTDLKPKARTWDRFNQFREWVENERRT